MATTPSIGTYGENLDLRVKQGSTFGATVIVTNPDGTVMDLTACTVRGQIRRKALDTALIVAFTCAVTDAEAGTFTFGLTDEQTADIDAGETTAKPDSNYVYDIEVEDSVGGVTPLLYGKVVVFREVTR